MLCAKAKAGHAFPSGVFNRDSSKVMGPREKTSLSAPVMDGHPQIHPFFQINLW